MIFAHVGKLQLKDQAKPPGLIACMCSSRDSLKQWRNRNIFRGGGKSLFPIFSRREMLYPGRNFHFGRPQTNLSCFKKVKSKIPNFYLSFYNFPSFSVHFSVFPCLFLPGRSAKIRWKTLWGTLPPAPVMPLALNLDKRWQTHDRLLARISFEPRQSMIFCFSFFCFT